MFQNFSLGPIFPFHYLADRTIYSPPIGTVFYEDFQGLTIFKQWLDDGLREQTTITREIPHSGEDRTTCLVIHHSSNSKWAYSYIQKIETKNGDMFYYEGLVDVTGDHAVAYLNIGAFDEYNKVIDWDFYKKKAPRKNGWTKVQNTITISDPRIRYISFRLVGYGSGEFWFDNILLKKIGESSTERQ